MREQNTENEVYEIDLLKMAKLLWQHAWTIVIATILVGALAFAYSSFLITPRYESSALMYVNNSSISLGGASFTFNASELSAAKSLVNTYAVILKTRTTLNAVIRKTGVDYTYEELYNMVSARSVDNTEIFAITVNSSDPEEAELLANTIADILPDKIGDIVEGSHVSVVDRAVVSTKKVSPSNAKNTAIGMLLGFILSCAVIILMDLFDDVIRDDDYLTQTYDIPVLGVIPDLVSRAEDRTGYGAARTGRE